MPVIDGEQSIRPLFSLFPPPSVAAGAAARAVKSGYLFGKQNSKDVPITFVRRHFLGSTSARIIAE